MFTRNKLLEDILANTISTSPEFLKGKIFRSFFELSLPAGNTRVFKFVISADIVLLSSSIDIDNGGIEYKVYAGGIESDTFTQIPSYRTNNMSGTPVVTSNVTVSSGGALDVSGQTVNDIIRVRSAGANSKQSTVGLVADDMRGFPATTAYVVVKALNGVNGTSTGVIKWQWQNR